MTTRESRSRSTTQQVLGWRAATATRVFALALATGQTLSAGRLDTLGLLLLGLAILAMLASTVDIDASTTMTRLITVAEGVLATTILVTSQTTVTPLLVYLAVPPAVAGLRSGWVTVLNTGLASVLALIGGWAATQSGDLSVAALTSALLWLALGLGVGLLAAWQTRSLRALEDSQAPLVEAHRLLTQLHTVSRQLQGGLDSEQAGQALLARVMEVSGGDRAVLFVRSGTTSVVPLTHTGGSMSSAEHDLAKTCLDRHRRIHLGPLGAVPVRIGEYDVGAVVVRRDALWRRPELERVQATVDRHGLQLDTALLFDDVRSIATTEERNRLARDIHDGVAQDVASLGYLVDELAVASDDPEVKQLAAELRAELTRVVGELRHSIFDLRQGVSEATGLSDALSDYARELGSRGDLQVQLALDVAGPPLPARTQAELLRIAQEAITNVRKHAQATTLWVTLTTDGDRARLEIADDGRASRAPTPRAGHYGLQTMRERADRIGADLTLACRPGGGTVVLVETRQRSDATSPQPEGADDDQRAARR